MTSPLYNVGDTAYLRESAAIGSLEAIRIFGLHRGPNGWLYSLDVSMSPPSAGGVLDRRSHVGTQTLYYTEDELISLCVALELVEVNAKAAYDRAKAQRNALCPDDTITG